MALPLPFIIIGGYALGGFLTWYILRFTETYHEYFAGDNEGVALLLFFWPIIGVIFSVNLLVKVISSGYYFRRLDFFICKLFKRRIQRDEYGTLYRLPSPYNNADGMRIVRVEDSTGTYWLPIPSEIQTAKAAVAWTYRIPEEDFNPIRA